MNDKELEWAVFWLTLLQPVLFDRGEINHETTNRFLRELATHEVLFPDGKLRKPSLSTLRRKLRRFREGGIEALERKQRSDLGKPRAHEQHVVDRAIALKRDLATRSNVVLNHFLKDEFKEEIHKSTLYRYLRDAGATRRKLGYEKKPVRRRWTRDHTHDLWIGDFEDGPYVWCENQMVPTPLCIFADCHSRFIVEGRYYYKHDLDVLIDALLRAWAVHGTCLDLYLDHAKVFHANALKAACFALNIHLIHRAPGDPSPGGLIEKIIQTTQSQFEPEIRAGERVILDRLNRGYWAWRDICYHREPNSETGEPPLERFEKGLVVPRPVDMEAVIPYFMHREQRTVHKDFCDVQLDRRFYRVDKRFRRDRVEVRYDPFGSQETVLIYSLKGEYLGKGTLHAREEGEPASSAPAQKPQFSFIDLLIRKHEEELRSRTQGIDYRKAVIVRPWPFPDFAKTVAQLMGRTGDLSSFSTDELEFLQKLYTAVPTVTRPLLAEAFEKANEKTLPYVAYQLQQLASRKES